MKQVDAFLKFYYDYLASAISDVMAHDNLLGMYHGVRRLYEEILLGLAEKVAAAEPTAVKAQVCDVVLLSYERIIINSWNFPNAGFG